MTTSEPKSFGLAVFDATAFGLHPEPFSEDEHGEGDATPAGTVQRPLEGYHIVLVEQPLNLAPTRNTGREAKRRGAWAW